MRFTSAKSYQTGLNVSDDSLDPIFGQLTLAIRHDVYLRERVLTSGAPGWQPETWS